MVMVWFSPAGRLELIGRFSNKLLLGIPDSTPGDATDLMSSGM